MAKKKRTKWNRQHQFKRKKSSKNGVGHPAYIYAQSVRNYKYLSFTHDVETDGVLNVPLQHNIDPDEKNKRSYMLPRHFVGSKEHFQDPDKKFRIHKDDMDTVKKYKK